MPGIDCSQILAARGYLPPYRYSQDELVSFATWGVLTGMGPGVAFEAALLYWGKLDGKELM